MPFGAHETMEVHEILVEKINMITHFNFYASQTKNPQLQDMIIRHQQEEIRSYDEIVRYTHDYIRFSPIPPNTNIKNIKPNQVQYGLNNPSMFAPESNAVLNDWEVATAMLQCHKNAAQNGMRATLECADPYLRQMILNSAANCSNQAYEVFLFMNEQGLYQVPELDSESAKTFLHSYQPAGEGLKAQYAVQTGQAMGTDQPMFSNTSNLNSAEQILPPVGQVTTSPQSNVPVGQTGIMGQNMAPYGRAITGMTSGQRTMTPFGQTTTGSTYTGSNLQQYGSGQGQSH